MIVYQQYRNHTLGLNYYLVIFKLKIRLSQYCKKDFKRLKIKQSNFKKQKIMQKSNLDYYKKSTMLCLIIHRKK